MPKIFLSIGALNACLSIALGALSAHMLKAYLSPEALISFQTGVQYHFYHSVGLILVGLTLERFPQFRALKFSGLLMLLGMLLFSGTLYLINLTGWRGIVHVVPLGGVCFMSAWLLFAWTCWQNRHT